jgi:hypothetical protein
MLLSFQMVVTSCGRVLLWENDRGFLTRLLVRAHVINLLDIPHFIVVSEGEGFQGQSWIVQCEVIEEEIMGALPVDEEPPLPPNDNGLPPTFDFFGLGQLGLGPFIPRNENQEEDLQNPKAWEPWVQ